MTHYCDVLIPFRIESEKQAGWLRESINSIVGQTVPCGVIAIDDCSPFDITAIRDQYPEVEWMATTANRGPYHACNLAMSRVTADWVAIQDADDVACGYRIEHAIDLMAKKGGHVFTANMVNFASDTIDPGSRLAARLQGRQLVESADGDNLTMVNGTMVIATEVFRQLGGFAEFFAGADYEFCQRLKCSAVKVCVSDVVVGHRRLWQGSLTGNDESTGIGSPFRDTVRKLIRSRIALYRVLPVNLPSYGGVPPIEPLVGVCLPDHADRWLVDYYDALLPESVGHHADLMVHVDGSYALSPQALALCLEHVLQHGGAAQPESMLPLTNRQAYDLLSKHVMPTGDTQPFDGGVVVGWSEAIMDATPEVVQGDVFCLPPVRSTKDNASLPPSTISPNTGESLTPAEPLGVTITSQHGQRVNGDVCIGADTVPFSLHLADVYERVADMNPSQITRSVLDMLDVLVVLHDVQDTDQLVAALNEWGTS